MPMLQGSIMSELYQLPDGWEWKKLGDLFTITSSKRVFEKDWLSDEFLIEQEKL